MKKEIILQKLKEEIGNLKKIQDQLLVNGSLYNFFHPLLNITVATMADLLCYLEGKQPYLNLFNEDFFNNRLAVMHRAFFADLHITIEEGLGRIIKYRNFKIEVSKYKQAASIIENIKLKLIDYSFINREFRDIMRLGGNHPTFNDYLNTVLKNVEELDKQYKKSCRLNFDAISIIRNKVSHSDMSLAEEEKRKLIAAKYGPIISPKGELQMTFVWYKYPLIDSIKFFNKLYNYL